LTLSFEQQPDYEGTIQAIKFCLNKSIVAQKPSGPPSNAQCFNHEFEWNRSIASERRHVLARQEEEFKEINQDVDFFKKLQFQSFQMSRNSDKAF